MIPPPPPMSPDSPEDDEALGSMLISWYMSGYHTGYYLVQLLFLCLKNGSWTGRAEVTKKKNEALQKNYCRFARYKCLVHFNHSMMNIVFKKEDGKTRS